MAKERFFGYQIPNSNTMLIGTAKKQIIRTLEYYVHERGQDLHIPSDEQITEFEEINITCALPMLKIGHDVEVRVRPNFIFWVNANAFDYVQDMVRDYERLKRGALYKFHTIDMFGLWFLPEAIMQGLKDYDWGQHVAQVDQWMAEREEILDEGERRGFIRRV